jgi:hypothetical protein
MLRRIVRYVLTDVSDDLTASIIRAISSKKIDFPRKVEVIVLLNYNKHKSKSNNHTSTFILEFVLVCLYPGTSDII